MMPDGWCECAAADATHAQEAVYEVVVHTSSEAHSGCECDSSVLFIEHADGSGLFIEHADGSVLFISMSTTQAEGLRHVSKHMPKHMSKHR